MSGYPSTLQNLIDELDRLQGVGRKQAERLAMHILRMPREEALRLADAIREVKTRIIECPVCRNVADQAPCRLCSDPRRDRSLICVVEQPKDLLAIESSGEYNGLYHVLGGQLSAMENVTAEDLTLSYLVDRVKEGGVREVIVATNADFEGEATANHIAALLRPLGVKVTLLARGIAAGSQIEYASRTTIRDALRGRVSL